MPIAPGDGLLRCRPVERIGEGGIGIGWRAHATSLDRQVAIKVLPDESVEEDARVRYLKAGVDRLREVEEKTRR